MPGAQPPAPRTLEVQMLPAHQGDCLLLQWPDGERAHRLLVDAGPARAYDAIARCLQQGGVDAVDELVLTHVDGDHVEGVILLLNDAGLRLRVGDVWFNGAAHLADELAPVHGEILGELLRARGLPWNAAFGGSAVRVPDAGPLPALPLPGGVLATVLGPDGRALRRLRDEWDAALREAGLAGASPEALLAELRARPRLVPEQAYLGTAAPDVRELARSTAAADSSPANGSSIVLLLERGDDRVLLAGDATPVGLLATVRRLLAERQLERLPLTAFKLPHHGSAKNVTTALLDLLPARRYLFSTDGSYFGHPDDAAVAKVLERGPGGLELQFGYDTPRNRRWDADSLRSRYGHTVTFAPAAAPAGGTARHAPVQLPPDRPAPGRPDTGSRR